MDPRDVTWVVSAAGIAAVYLLWQTQKNKKVGLDIVDVEYDKHSRRLELTVENLGERSVNVKSVLRLVKYKEGDAEFLSSGVPMMTGSVRSSNVLGFDLLAADEYQSLVPGNSKQKFAYLVPDNLALKPNDNIKVDLTSDRGHTATIVPLKFQETVVDIAVEAERDIDKLIDRIDKQIAGIEKKRGSASANEKITLLWEEEILKDIEAELFDEKGKLEESVSHLVGFTNGVGMSVYAAS